MKIPIVSSKIDLLFQVLTNQKHKHLYLSLLIYYIDFNPFLVFYYISKILFLKVDQVSSINNLDPFQ